MIFTLVYDNIIIADDDDDVVIKFRHDSLDSQPALRISDANN